MSVGGVGPPARPPRGSAPAIPWWNPKGWGQTFSALENPAFARYFWATFGFFFAMQMQMLLRGYLIYDLTGDPFSLGLISVTFAAPMLLLAPVAGVVADRIDRRKIIVTSQVIGLALTALTTALILTATIAFWHLLVISLFSSSTIVFNMPARQAMVPALVGPERLMNAIAPWGATSSMHITSFSWNALLHATATHAHPNLAFGFLSGTFDSALIQRCVQHGLDQVCPPARLLERGLVDEAHERGLVVRAWGVRERRDVDLLFATGADGATINWPEWILDRR